MNRDIWRMAWEYARYFESRGWPMEGYWGDADIYRSEILFAWEVLKRRNANENECCVIFADTMFM